MKRPDLKILENADKETIEKMSERYCNVDEKEAEKIYRRSIEKCTGIIEEDAAETISGVEVITRRRRSVAVRVAAAAAAVAVCVTGTVYAIGRTKFKPEKETLATSDEAPALLDNTASATEGTVPDTKGEAPDNEVNEYLKCWKPFELDGWTFRVDMLHITKSSRGMTFRQNEYYPCDEKGVFTCDQSYIVADMTVTNNSGEDREYYTNSSAFYCFDRREDGSINWETAVCADVYDFNGEKSVQDADFFRTTIKAGETKYFRIGYRIADSELDRKFDYVCIDFGTYLVDSDPDKGKMAVGGNMKLSEIPPIKEYDMSTQEGVYYKMLNSVKYFSRAQGAYIVNDGLGNKLHIDFWTDFPSSKAITMINNCNIDIVKWEDDSKPEVNDASIPGVPVDYTNDDTKPNVINLEILDKERTVYYSDGIKIYNYRYEDEALVENKISGSSHRWESYSDAPDESRHYVIDGIDNWKYVNDYTNLVYARTYLSPQEMTYGYLTDFSNWEIVGTESYNERECMVIRGKISGEYSQKHNVTDFTFFVDKETGVLLRYIGRDANGEISESVMCRFIAFDDKAAEGYDFSPETGARAY